MSDDRLTYWEVMKLARIYEVLRHSDAWEEMALQIENLLRDEALTIMSDVEERKVPK